MSFSLLELNGSKPNKKRRGTISFYSKHKFSFRFNFSNSHGIARSYLVTTIGVNNISLMVIPQKLKLPMIFFLNFPSKFSNKHYFEKTIKMIGLHSRLRDMMGKCYPIYACTRANHAHYSSVNVTFCGSSKHTKLK